MEIPVTSQRNWDPLYQDSHFQLFTRRIFFSCFRTKTPMCKKDKHGVAVGDKDVRFPIFLDARSPPINVILAPQQNIWGFMKQGSKTSVLQTRCDLLVQENSMPGVVLLIW